MVALLKKISVLGLFWIPFVTGNLQPPILTPSIISPTKSLGDCQACKLLVDSIKKGLERTARGKFEGGDAAWEEEKLKSYQNSEVRLVEVQESLCTEIKKHQVQCHSLAETAEEYIEDWWFNKQETHDIFEYLCIEKLKYCCPAGHFGRNCQPCRTNLENPCNGNGHCKGNGTRKGSGLCACDTGYSGEQCDKCASGFYSAYKDDTKLLCSPCHNACDGECSQGGPKGCVVCASGWVMDSEEGCFDINECEEDNICGVNKFCVNKEGSHQCLACDKSCRGCYGDGPDLCYECAAGYSRKGDLCIANRENEYNHDHLTNTRYFTYAGLLVATIILLPKSTMLGGTVGVMVIAYIIGSEYYCMINGHSHGIVDLSKYDLSTLFKR